MATLIYSLIEKYNEAMDKTRDPRVESWMFMKSPFSVLGILMVYLLFILVIGPRYMKNRPPFELKNIIVIYNAYQILFSSWLLSKALNIENSISIVLTQCGSVHLSKEYSLILTSAAWWYLFSKIVDLLDTVFFVLRKKQSQVTFLHVYHHFLMVFFTWVYLRIFPGEQGAFIGALNSLVHVVMYTYYLIAALGPEYHKYLWWKKYMTWMQLGQFFIMLIYLLYITAIDCALPKGLTIFFAVNIVVFLYLFFDFYRKAYNKDDKVKINKRQSGVVVNNKKVE